MKPNIYICFTQKDYGAVIMATFSMHGCSIPVS